MPGTKLGLGEREAMALAAELHAILIVDDGLARAAEMQANGPRVAEPLVHASTAPQMFPIRNTDDDRDSGGEPGGKATHDHQPSWRAA